MPCFLKNSRQRVETTVGVHVQRVPPKREGKKTGVTSSTVSDTQRERGAASSDRSQARLHKYRRQEELARWHTDGVLCSCECWRHFTGGAGICESTVPYWFWAISIGLHLDLPMGSAYPAPSPFPLAPLAVSYPCTFPTNGHWKLVGLGGKLCLNSRLCLQMEVDTPNILPQLTVGSGCSGDHISILPSL